MLISQQTADGADDPEWIKTAFKKENPNQALKGVPLPRRHASHDVQVGHVRREEVAALTRV